MPEVLALDLGTKRIGVARADTKIKLPEVLEPISVDGTEFDKLQVIINNLKVSTVVVGVPLGDDDKPTLESGRVNKVIGNLKDKFESLKIITQNEVDSSLAADQIKQMHYNKDSKVSRDSLAAAVILQRYLNNL